MPQKSCRPVGDRLRVRACLLPLKTCAARPDDGRVAQICCLCYSHECPVRTSATTGPSSTTGDRLCDGCARSGTGFHTNEEEATQKLKEELMIVEQRVQGAITAPLTDNEYAALVSFAANGGDLAPISSLLRQNNYRAVPSAIQATARAGGHAVQGLERRRGRESALFTDNSCTNSGVQDETVDQMAKIMQDAAREQAHVAAVAKAPAAAKPQSNVKGAPSWYDSTVDGYVVLQPV